MATIVRGRRLDRRLGVLIGLGTSIALVAVTATTAASVGEPNSTDAQLRRAAHIHILNVVKHARAAAGLPAVTAARVVGGHSIVGATVGLVRDDRGTPVAKNARFHLGSLSKGVLATAIGALSETGEIGFDTTIAETFPGRVGTLDPAYRDITVRNLLTHRAGVEPFTHLREFADIPRFRGSALERQRSFALWLLKRPPSFRVGSFHYSNAGYTIAAVMAEKAAGMSWRDLVRDRVFDPLGVGVWFGWPGRHGARQPWGHVERRGAFHAVAPGKYQLPTVIAPAGNLSVSARGLARYLRMHLIALRGHRTRVIGVQTARLLHDPVGFYSCGWVESTFRGTPISVHDGTAGTFYAYAALVPEHNTAAVVVTNATGKNVDVVIAGALVRLAFHRPSAANVAREVQRIQKLTSSLR